MQPHKLDTNNNNELSNPHIQVQTPNSTLSSPQSMLAQPAYMGGGWNEISGGPFLSAIPRNFQDPRYHKRASSGSSVTSAGPPSPLDQANIYHPRIAPSDISYSPSRFEYESSPGVSKIHQSHQDSPMMFQPLYNNTVDMRRIQSQGPDDRTSYTGAPSVSTMSHQNSPATPQNWEDYSDDKAFTGFPTMAYTQSIQDLFPNETMTAQSAAYNIAKLNNHRQSMMQERLHEAQQLRTSSPTSNPRDKSPFKPGSEYMRPGAQQSQQMPLLQKQRTSISPKELMLDERDLDDNQPSLFPEHSAYNARRQRSNLSNTYNASFLSQETSSLQMPQTYPFVSQSSSQNVLADSTPDFPAPMLSMESTNEEGVSEPSSQQSSHRPIARSEPQQSTRPVDTSSNAGTYSCTYHGCPERFESPVKLQKHKRDAHRSHEPVSPSITLRNSQAGPHRCDRINPSTGKPCNSIFSRPYDLTRHEDTIHNGKKQKVRCHLCTEEKTFSRNDALTRHMRVVHPDVDWVGKQKRRSHK